MPTLPIKKSQTTKSSAAKKVSAQSNAPSRRKVTSALANAKMPLKADEPKVERVTKQRVLTMLYRSDSASIKEMMQATDWQQHSVRGFLAGTVKKKLGSFAEVGRNVNERLEAVVRDAAVIGNRRTVAAIRTDGVGATTPLARAAIEALWLLFRFSSHRFRPKAGCRPLCDL